MKVQFPDSFLKIGLFWCCYCTVKTGSILAKKTSN